MQIRPAVARDLPLLQDLELAAGTAFREIGMAAVADDPPMSLDTLDAHRADGRLWVTGDPDEEGRPVAYLLHLPVDGATHIEQVSVDPRHAHRGLGRALIEDLAWRVSTGGPTALTLTTFRDVPWNAPYYERLGFRALRSDEVTPGLRAIRREEAAHGLDRWPRVCMRRELTPTATPRA